MSIGIDLWSVYYDRTADRSSKIAISSKGGSLTFGDVFMTSKVWAKQISGVPRGSIGILALPNTLEFLPAYLALTKLGLCVALVSPRRLIEQTAQLWDLLRPSVCITTKEAASKLILPHFVVATLVGAGRPDSAPVAVTFNEDRPSQAAFAPAHASLVKFTKGSTGPPKGILLSSDNLCAEAECVTNSLDMTTEDRILAVLPLYHSYAFDLGVLNALWSGATLIVGESLHPQAIARQMLEQRISVFLGIPRLYAAMTRACKRKHFSLHSIRYLLTCTAPLSLDLSSSFWTTFGARLCQHYGLSETGAVTVQTPRDAARLPATVGLPMKGVEVRIYDQDGVPLARNKIGIVAIRSRAVAMSYIPHGAPGRERFGDNEYRTEDLGLIDEEGYLYLTGRCKTL